MAKIHSLDVEPGIQVRTYDRGGKIVVAIIYTDVTKFPKGRVPKYFHKAYSTVTGFYRNVKTFSKRKVAEGWVLSIDKHYRLHIYKPKVRDQNSQIGYTIDLPVRAIPLACPSTVKCLHIVKNQVSKKLVIEIAY